MAHNKIFHRVSHLLIMYLLVFDRIHNGMCLNKMSRTSSRNIGPQHQKYNSLYLSDFVFLCLCFLTLIWSFLFPFISLLVSVCVLIMSQVSLVMSPYL